MAEFTPLQRVEVANVDALNIFHRARKPLACSLAGEPATLASLWPLPPIQVGGQGGISFSIGDSHGEVRLPRSLLEQWLAKADPDLRLGRLAPDHVALLLEALLGDSLAKLENGLGQRIELTRVDLAERKPSHPSAYAFTLTHAQGDATVLLQLDDPEIAGKLACLLDGVSQGSSAIPDELPVPVRFWRGAVSVTLSDLGSLRPGDVVLLDEADSLASGPMICVGDRLLAALEIADAEARLKSFLRPKAGSKWEWIMDRANDTGEPLQDADLDGLPVTLVFELGRTVMPVGDLKQLAPGSVVSLPAEADETVDIIANGKRVGRGNIVRIGESLGVRLVRMFDNA